MASGRQDEKVIGLLLAGLFVLPIVATLHFSSTFANFLGACFMLALAITARLAFSNKPRSRKVMPPGLAIGLVAAVAVILAGWIYQGIEFWSDAKLATYVSGVLLFFAFSRAFECNDTLVGLLSRIKLIVLAGVSLVFLIYIFFSATVPVFTIKAQPPLFSHLRHLNYELYFGIILAIGGYLTARRKGLFLTLLLLLLFLSVWSGGRGSALAVLAALIFLGIFSRPCPFWKTMGMLLILGTVATALVFATGKQQVLRDTLGYSSVIFVETEKTQSTQSGNPASLPAAKLKRFTAGRTGMWYDSVAMVTAHGAAALLTGLGPDAYRKFQIRPGFVHPHNSLVQIFMEFGLLGLGMFGLLLLRFIKVSVEICRNSGDLRQHLAAAMFVGGVVFSMADGIFHHVGPFAMMIFAMAFLQSITSVASAEENRPAKQELAGFRR